MVAIIPDIKDIPKPPAAALLAWAYSGIVFVKTLRPPIGGLSVLNEIVS